MAYLIAACLVASTAAAQLNFGTKPVRVILVVDSSSTMGGMINPVRAALNAFLDGLLEDAVNLATNTNGTYEVINSTNSLPDKMKAVAARISNEP